MSRYRRPTQIIETLPMALLITTLSVGCATLEPPADLIAYQNQLNNKALVSQAKTVAPEPYQASQRYYTMAKEACDEGEAEPCQNYATLAKIKMQAVEAHVGAAAADARFAAAEQQAQAAQKQLGNELARNADYERRIARMEKIEKLQANLEQATSTAEAERARTKLELEKQALAAGSSRAQFSKQQVKLDALLDRNTLFQAAAGVVGDDNVKQVTSGIVVTVRDLFPTKKTQVQKEKLAVSEQLAHLALQHPSYPVIIEGHTDAQGGASANLALSQARAQAVMQLFLEDKVPVERIKAVGYGEDRPITENRTQKGRAENRRIDVKFLFVTDPTKSSGKEG